MCCLIHKHGFFLLVNFLLLFLKEIPLVPSFILLRELDAALGNIAKRRQSKPHLVCWPVITAQYMSIKS